MQRHVFSFNRFFKVDYTIRNDFIRIQELHSECSQQFKLYTVPLRFYIVVFYANFWVDANTVIYKV